MSGFLAEKVTNHHVKIYHYMWTHDLCYPFLMSYLTSWLGVSLRKIFKHLVITEKYSYICCVASWQKIIKLSQKNYRYTFP